MDERIKTPLSVTSTLCRMAFTNRPLKKARDIIKQIETVVVLELLMSFVTVKNT